MKRWSDQNVISCPQPTTSNPGTPPIPEPTDFTVFNDLGLSVKACVENIALGFWIASRTQFRSRRQKIIARRISSEKNDSGLSSAMRAMERLTIGRIPFGVFTLLFNVYFIVHCLITPSFAASPEASDSEFFNSPGDTVFLAAEDPDAAETPWGLTTFANVPYVSCQSKNKHVAYDIAILGAPFDTATTGRPGARFGPRAIRSGSWRINPEEAWSVYTGENVFKSRARIVDCGDVPMTWLDNTIAFRQLEEAHEVLSSRRPTSKRLSPFPRVVTLGGDHTTTLFALRAVSKKWGKVAVVHFDAHIGLHCSDLVRRDPS